MCDMWNFKDRFDATEGPELLKLNEPVLRVAELELKEVKHPTREPPGLECAVWLELKDMREVWRPSMLPLAVDIMITFPWFLPLEVAPQKGELYVHSSYSRLFR